jgi:hypothetical protein
MKVVCILLAVLPLATACGSATQDEHAAPAFNENRVAAIEAGARREQADVDEASKSGSKGDVRYITNGFISVCPDASDWFKMQDAVLAGDNSVNLPSRCQQLSPGTIVIAPEEGRRETVRYKGHEYEKGRFEDGRAFWTDELDNSVLSKA